MKEDFKSPVITIAKGSTMKEARELMKERRIRHLPVVGSDGGILGILSHRDMTDLEDLQNYPVELLASKPVIYVVNTTPLQTVALKMIEEKISSVLLTDEQKNVTGIITTDDLLYQLALILKDRPEESSRPWTGSDSLVTAGEFFRKLADIGI